VQLCGRHSCDFEVMVSGCHLIAIVLSPPGTPAYLHTQDIAGGGHGGGAPVSVLSDLEDALLEAELRSPRGVSPCPWYFMSKIGLALCPSMYWKSGENDLKLLF